MKIEKSKPRKSAAELVSAKGKAEYGGEMGVEFDTGVFNLCVK